MMSEKGLEVYGACVLVKRAAISEAEGDAILQRHPAVKWILGKGEVGAAAIRPPQSHILCRRQDVAEAEEPMASCRQNQVLYVWYPLRSMFCRGNIPEKLRLASIMQAQAANAESEAEVVLDLYAGIGYWSLVALRFGRVRHLYACDLNPWSLRAFRHGLHANRLDIQRVTCLLGDNAQFEGVVAHRCHRVFLGLLPDGLVGVDLALQALLPDTVGTLHIHRLVAFRSVALKDALEQSMEEIRTKLHSPACQLVKCQLVKLGVARVKSYAPRVDHYVFDCTVLKSGRKESTLSEVTH
jgi:tRNA G37 N-methylase Trm5